MVHEEELIERNTLAARSRVSTFSGSLETLTSIRPRETHS